MSQRTSKTGHDLQEGIISQEGTEQFPKGELTPASTILVASLRADSEREFPGNYDMYVRPIAIEEDFRYDDATSKSEPYE